MYFYLKIRMILNLFNRERAKVHLSCATKLTDGELVKGQEFHINLDYHNPTELSVAPGI